MTTEKQKKILIIVAAVFIGSYVLRYIVNFAANAAYSYQARSAQAAQPEAKQSVPATTPPPTPTTTPTQPEAPPALAAVEPNATAAEVGGAPAVNPPSPPPIQVPASFGALAGQWTGRTAIKGRGTCIVSLELTENIDAPGHFSGASKILCYPDATTSRDRQAQAAKVNPQAAIFNGTIDQDAIHLNVQKNIAADPHGCYFLSMDLSPFGARQLATTWAEASPCTGGTVILQKVR